MDYQVDLEAMLVDENAEPKALPFSFLEEITGGFSQYHEIGRGGFAVVYRGILGTGTVAVKKLSMAHIHETEFQREVECLMSVKHKNIVRFLGYCADTQGSMQRYKKKYVMADVQQRLLCFEYVPKGSLHDYITDASRGLAWRHRYQIIKGVCEGLNYLHMNRVVHLDLKPANILMDDNMEPKIADFGLSRCFDEGESLVMATKVAGTLGYLPPEFDSRAVTRHYDVYSLGVIIMEILTGKKGYHTIEDVLDSWRNRSDESLEDTELEQIQVCANIGKECTKKNPKKRPRSVQHIIDRLKETERADELSLEMGMINYFGACTQMRLSMPTERGLLHVHQCKLQFPMFEPVKRISCPLRLTNKTNDLIAFRCFPKLLESFTDGFSKLKGTVLPRSTRTFLVWMEKQPPQDLEAFDVILECCVAHKDLVVDVDDNFLPEFRQRIGGKVHQVPLVVVCHPAGETIYSEPFQSQTKIICTIERKSYLVSMDVHPVEPWILVGHYDGHISIWNYETGARLMALQIVEDFYLVRYCIFISRKHWIVAGDGYGYIHVHSCKTLELDKVIKFKAHTDWIQALAVHQSLPLLVSGCSDGVIKLWDWEDWTCIRTFKGHTDRVEALIFNPHDESPDYITFASVSLDCTAKIWETSSPLSITTLDCSGQQQCWVDYFPLTSDGDHYIITGSLSGNARVWDLQTRKCVQVIKGLLGWGSNACVVDCLPYPPLLITSLANQHVGLCNPTTLRYKNTIDFELGIPRNSIYVKGIRRTAVWVDANKDLYSVISNTDSALESRYF